MKTLYEALGLKREKSIFKSVAITDKKTSEGFSIVEVEPFDDTFLNAIKYPSLYDKTLDKILKAVYNYCGADMWLIIDTDEYGHSEILVSEYNMKEVYHLI